MLATMKWRVLDGICLMVLLTIVGLRPLVTESFHTANSAREFAPGLHDPATWHTLLINITILTTALLVACRKLFSNSAQVQKCGIEFGALTLLFAAAVACWNASEQRPARLSAIDLLSAVALAWTLVQLIKYPWQRWLTISTIVAAGMVNVAESFDQKFYSMPETEKQYQLDRESIWANKGVALDSPEVVMYENRMRSREANGYFSHSNVYGGYVLLTFFALIGCLLYAYRIRSSDGGVGLVVAYAAFALAAGLGVFFSNSLGAMASATLILFLLALVVVRQDWWDHNRQRVYRSAIALIIMAVTFVVSYGAATDSLPGASLDFRWQYWRASSEMFGDHWLTGVGPENFGEAYLEYKTIGNSEEVKNPHNAAVQIATEYGMLGLFALFLLLLGGANAYASNTSSNEIASRRGANHEHRHMLVPLYGTFVVVITVAVFTWRYPMLPSQDRAFVEYSLIIALPVWLFLHAVGMLLAYRGEAADLPTSRWMPAIGFGLLAFMLQDTINFAFYVPGARTTFAALFAASIACRRLPEATESAKPTAGEWAIPAMILFTLAWCAHEYSMVKPAETALIKARRLAANDRSFDDVNANYLEARAADPLNAEIPVEHARWLLRTATATPSQSKNDLNDLFSIAIDAIVEATNRAHNKYTVYRLRSQIHMMRHRLGISEDAAQAVSSMRIALERYPSRPMSHVELANYLVELSTCESLQEARKHLNRAIEMDAERPDWEKVRRFNARQKSDIDARLDHVRELLAERDCADE